MVNRRDSRRIDGVATDRPPEAAAPRNHEVQPASAGSGREGPVDAPIPVRDERTPRLRYRGAMSTTHTFFPNLAAEAPVPARGIHSQTLSDEAGVELVLFAFAEGDLKVGDDAYAATAGTWLRMAADTRHSLLARTPLVMALYLLSREDPSRP
jgi:hypothetical protein